MFYFIGIIGSSHFPSERARHWEGTVHRQKIYSLAGSKFK
jgi:hypothetical protein